MKIGIIRAVEAGLQAGNLPVAAGVLAELFDHAPDLPFFVKDGAGLGITPSAYRQATREMPPQGR